MQVANRVSLMGMQTEASNGIRQEDFGKVNQEIETEYLDEFGDGDLTQYSDRVTDPETLGFLNGQKTIKTYKSMLLVDGKRYLPVA